MCHCFESIKEMSEAEQEAIIEEHDEAELRAEYSSEELEQLGIAA